MAKSKKSNTKKKAKIFTYKNIMMMIAGLTLIAGLVQCCKPDKKEYVMQMNHYLIGEDAVNKNGYGLYPIKEPDNANVFYHQGLEFMKQTNYEKASELFEKAAIEQMETGELSSLEAARYTYSLGLSYFYDGKIENAIDEYTKAIGILDTIIEEEEKLRTEPEYKPGQTLADIPDNEVKYERGYVHLLRGNAYLVKKDYDTALADTDVAKGCIYYGDGLYSETSILHLVAKCQADIAVYNRDWRYLESAFENINLALFCKGVDMYNENNSDKNEDDILIHASITGFDNLILSYKNNLFVWETGNYFWKVKTKDAEMAEILTDRAMIEAFAGRMEWVVDDCESALTIYDGLSKTQKKDIYGTYWLMSTANLCLAAEETDDEEKQTQYLEKSIAAMLQGIENIRNNNEEYSEKDAYAKRDLGIFYLAMGNVDAASDYLYKSQDIFHQSELPTK